MNATRIAVEWGFGDVTTQWKYVDYGKQLKKGIFPIGIYYKVSVFLTNCMTCMRGGKTAQYFGLSPPSIEENIGWAS